MEWLFLFVVLGWMFFRVVFAKIGDVLYMSEEPQKFEDWHFPDVTSPYLDIITKSIKTCSAGLAIYWWNNLSDETKKKLDKRVYNAFQKKMKETLTLSDENFLAKNK